MSKKMKLRLVCLLGVTILGISGCAKREEDVKTNIKETDQVTIEEAAKDDGTHINRKLGESGNELIIDADIIVPRNVKEGKVKVGFPDVSIIEKNLCQGKQMEQIKKNEWAIKPKEKKSYLYEKYYGYDEQFASFYDALLMEQTRKESPNKQNEEEVITSLKEKGKTLLEQCGYTTAVYNELREEGNGTSVELEYVSMLDGVWVAENRIGFLTNDMTISEQGIKELRFGKQYTIVNQEDTTVLPISKIIDILQQSMNHNQFMPLDETITRIRLGYYVDEQQNLIPVWCFSFKFDKDECLAYCVNAKTGKMVFDYQSYSTPGEAED